MTNVLRKHSPATAPLPEIIRLLGQPTPLHPVFDDDLLEPILYGGSPSPPTPASVTEMIEAGVEVSDECLRAFAEILANHPDKLKSFAETTATKHKEEVLSLLSRMSRESASDNAGFLKSLGRCMGHLGRAEESFDLRTRAREAELRHREAAYLSRVKATPRDATVHNEFALFLKNERYDGLRAEAHYRKALELAPANATYLSNMAVLLMSLGRYDEAESLFRQSLQLKPNDSNTLSNLATLLHNFSGRSQEAEEIFLQGVEVDSHDAALRTNFAALLIGRDAWPQAALRLAEAWKIQTPVHDKISGRILFLRIALDMLEGKDCNFHIGQLKSLFDTGIVHSPWMATAILAFVQEKVAPEDAEFLHALFNALTHWNGLALLRRFDRWTNQTPLPLTLAWP